MPVTLLVPVVESLRHGIAELSEDGKKVLRTVDKPRAQKSNIAVIRVHSPNSSILKVYPKLKPS